MKKVFITITFILTLCSSRSFAQSLSEACEYALGIDEWTKTVRSVTSEPLSQIPVDVYMRFTKNEAFIQYKNIADSRDDDDEECLVAKCGVAYCYYNGIGTKKDEEMCRLYLEKAAQKDFAPALNFLGWIEEGKDKSKALEYYTRSADKNYVTSLYNLSAYYLSLCNDDKVTDEYMSDEDWGNYNETAQKSLSYLEKIRENHLDDENILFLIAEAHRKLYGKEDAAPYYIEAAENGNTTAMFYLYMYLYPEYTDERAKWRRKYYEARAKEKEENIKLEEEKLPYLLRHAEKGDADSMYILCLYYSGLHPNCIKSLEWMKKAADAGNEYCSLYLGSYGDINSGAESLSEEKKAEIAELEKRSAENDLIATFELAKEYDSNSDTKSQQKAYDLFTKTVYIFENVEYEYVSEENSWKRLEYTGKACYFLGKYLKEGQLEDSNFEKAKEFFEKGMFYADASCAYELGVLLENGYWDSKNKVFRQDIDYAIECYQTAAKKDNQRAAMALRDYNIRLDEEQNEEKSVDETEEKPVDEETAQNFNSSLASAIREIIEKETSRFPDELPPVTDERLQEILSEIVERENRIISEEESDTPFIEDDYIYLHSNGNTWLIDPNETSPYQYTRIRGDANLGIPNFIIVVYARPTKANMGEYILYWLKAKYDTDWGLEILDFDKDFYKKAKSQTLHLHTTVKIGGEDYEIMFTDIDDN